MGLCFGFELGRCKLHLVLFVYNTFLERTLQKKKKKKKRNYTPKKKKKIHTQIFNNNKKRGAILHTLVQGGSN